MRALVTGGAGFIGSHLVEALIGQGDDVAVLDDLSTGSRSNLSMLEGNRRLAFHDGSILDPEIVDYLVREADVVYHLAAAVGVKWVLDHPLRSLLTNVRGTEIILDRANAHTKKVVLASTSEVYGKNDTHSLQEDDDRILGSSRLARWHYATAKALDESLALSYWYERQLGWS